MTMTLNGTGFGDRFRIERVAASKVLAGISLRIAGAS